MKTALYLVAEFPDGAIWEAKIPNKWIEEEAKDNRYYRVEGGSSLPESSRAIINQSDLMEKGEQEHYIEAFTCGQSLNDFRWKTARHPNRRKTFALYSVLWTNNNDLESIEPKLKIVAR